jgi:hypothetical protein
MAGRPRRKERLAREALERAAHTAPREPPKPPASKPPKPPASKAPKPPKPKLQLQRYARQHVIQDAHGDPLEIFRVGLALARRAGMPWEQAIGPACITSLSVESDSDEREHWANALHATLTAWRNAYERRPTASSL